MLSPGPCTPNEAGICLDLIAAAAGRIPLLGVCLGHQAIGQAFGASVVRGAVPMHGKVSPVRHAGTDIFEACRALSRPPATTAWSSPPTPCPTRSSDRLDRGRRHHGPAPPHRPVFGVQFHPESIASEHGHALLGNFLAIAARPRTASAPACMSDLSPRWPASPPARR